MVLTPTCADINFYVVRTSNSSAQSPSPSKPQAQAAGQGTQEPQENAVAPRTLGLHRPGQAEAQPVSQADSSSSSHDQDQTSQNRAAYCRGPHGSDSSCDSVPMQPRQQPPRAWLRRTLDRSGVDRNEVGRSRRSNSNQKVWASENPSCSTEEHERGVSAGAADAVEKGKVKAHHHQHQHSRPAAAAPGGGGGDAGKRWRRCRGLVQVSSPPPLATATCLFQCSCSCGGGAFYRRSGNKCKYKLQQYQVPV